MTAAVPAAAPAARPVAWPARVLAAVAVAVSGVVHLYLVLGEDYGGGDGNWLRYAFLAQGIGGIVLAVLLLVWRSVLPLLGAVAYGAATFGGFLLAVYLPDGLLGVHSMWGGWPETVSAVTEVLAVLAGSWALLLERRR